MNKIVLVGPINDGNVPATGDTMKNQLFLKRFHEVFDKVLTVDTINWKRRPWVLLQLVLTVALNRDAKVVISANPNSADKIIKCLRKLHLNNNLYYWVVGGSLHIRIKNSVYDIDNYRDLKAIYVQGQSMVAVMNELGLNNVFFVPNSKYIDFVPKKPIKQDEVTHFVFLSRIEEYKGCDDIIKCVDILNDKGYRGKYDITFYGKTTDELDYSEKFQKEVDEHSEVSYKGLLNLRDTSNYEELASYDVMLFPTYWMGEGFPGAIVDAYIAGLPVIASDWNLNREVVEEGKTGWIIPVHDIGALAEKMIYAIENAVAVNDCSENSMAKAMNYDIRYVLSEDNLKKIGLI